MEKRKLHSPFSTLLQVDVYDTHSDSILALFHFRSGIGSICPGSEECKIGDLYLRKFQTQQSATQTNSNMKSHRCSFKFAQTGRPAMGNGNLCRLVAIPEW